MQYKANPVIVDAFKIAEIVNAPPSDDAPPRALCCLLEDGREVYPDAGMTARYMPVPGDYWVVQDDGYAYINPKAVFERKYSPVKEKKGG